MSDALRSRWAVASVMLIASCAVEASVPTLDECLEGSDFIADAAWSRDHGLTRDAFLSRLEGDFETIRAFPPSLRWFAKDEDDERFLYASAALVFDAPLAPDGHRTQFLNACFERLGVPEGNS